MPAVPHSYIPHIATSPDVERRPRCVDATHGDALPLSPLTSNAGSRPASSLRAWLGSFGEKVADGLRDFFGPVEFTTGYFCNHCDDVHEEGMRCPRALMGHCLDCRRWRPLDHYGNCPCGSRSVTQRRLRYPDARKRLINRERNANV